MSDHDDPPTDLMDAIFRLDDIAEWLTFEGYAAEADRIAAISHELKGFITIRLAGPEQP